MAPRDTLIHMLTRRRLVVVGLLVVGLAAGWANTLRDGRTAGQAAAAGAPPISGTTTASTAPLASIGSLRDRLRRLPQVAPGDLEGVVDLGGTGCSRQRLDLGTLVLAATPRDICAAPGAKFGVRLRDVRRNLTTLGVIDTDGNFAENVAVPEGWEWWGLTADGLVFCDTREDGRLRRFGGGTTSLPSCPLTLAPEGLLFAGAGRRHIVDAAGRRVVSLRRSLPSFASVRPFGDGLIAVDADLYRGGRLIASLDLADGVVLGASRDGDVALVSDVARAHLAVMARDGTRRAIDPALASREGAFSPDGQHLLVQRDADLVLELDAATLRPLARLDLDPRAELLDWRSAP
jgi:hypothetical protein